MRSVKIGSRVTLMLLLAVIPVISAYTFWNIARSKGSFVNDLKREIRATSRGLAPALANDLHASEWSRISDILQRVSSDGTSVAVLNADGRVRFALPDFPLQLIPGKRGLESLGANGFLEFERAVGDHTWFVRVVPLEGKGDREPGYLLVGQDWTDFSQDVEVRTIGSAIAALALFGLIATIIPLVVHRYVSRPLAKLSSKVMRFAFADENEQNRHFERDEVMLLTEEFRKLDDQLNKAHSDLINKHRRELDLERRLQHADRLATIGTLASGLAHEIGTPMGIIRTRAELLLKAAPEASKNVEIIINQIDRISRIVRMLLEYARPRESRRIVCDVRQVVQTALGLIEMEAVRRNVQVERELGVQPLLAEGDPDQLQQVFVNLAVNALDAMAAKGGVLRVSAETQEDEAKPALEIIFEDSGTGVPLPDRARVFDPFFTTKEPGKGTGMGLAVSQSIMHDHDGEIGFDSRPTGARFFVTIPLISARARERAGTGQ
jgi:two-component system NtrC family sensor kinase